jgi:hypothetical protein
MKMSEMRQIPHDIPLISRDRPRIPQRNFFGVSSLSPQTVFRVSKQGRET